MIDAPIDSCTPARDRLSVAFRRADMSSGADERRPGVCEQVRAGRALEDEKSD
jgi:hypothetical protein